jgi:anti-sigma B factor antagonist
MDLKTHTMGSVTVLELAGRFDAYEAPAVNEALEKAVVSPPARVVVDLSGVNFIDSTGLATLVTGMKHCRQKEGDLYLCCLQQPVRIIFELTRLDKAFQLLGDRQAAVSAFEQGTEA